MLIGRRNINLFVPRKPIHKGKYLTPNTFINDLVNKRSGIIILKASMVNVTGINIDPKSALFLIHMNNIGNPFYQGNQIDKTNSKKFFMKRGRVQPSWRKS